MVEDSSKRANGCSLDGLFSVEVVFHEPYPVLKFIGNSVCVFKGVLHSAVGEGRISRYLDPGVAMRAMDKQQSLSLVLLRVAETNRRHQEN